MTAVQEFVVRVGEHDHRVRIAGEQAWVDGVAMTVLASPGDAMVVREAGGHGQCRVSLDGQARAQAASLHGVAVTVAVQTAQAAALAEAMASGAGKRNGGTQLKAPMPGRVVRVVVSEGQEVLRGAPVVIVEAMKMENEMYAPVDGKVAKVHVREGMTVDAGQLLVEMVAS